MKKLIAVLTLVLVPAFAGALTEPTYVFGPNTPNFLVGSQGPLVSPQWSLMYAHRSTDVTKVTYVNADPATHALYVTLTGTGGKVNIYGAVTLGQGPATSASLITNPGNLMPVAPAPSATFATFDIWTAVNVTSTPISVANAAGATLTLDAKCVGYEIIVKGGLSATENVELSPDDMASITSGSNTTELGSTDSSAYTMRFVSRPGRYVSKVVYVAYKPGTPAGARDFVVGLRQYLADR